MDDRNRQRGATTAPRVSLSAPHSPEVIDGAWPEGLRSAGSARAGDPRRARGSKTRIAACWLVLLLIAAGLRLFALGAKSLWLDEALSWRMQSFPVSTMLQRVSECSHPPLYFLLLRLWTECFGDSETALRFPAALLGISTVPLVFLFVKELMAFSPKGRFGAVRASILASALVGLSAYHVHFAKQVRGYTLGIFLFVLSSWALLRALRATDAGAARRRWLAYSLLALAFCYTHNLAVFSVGAQTLFAVLYLWQGVAGTLPKSCQPEGFGMIQRKWAIIAVLLLFVGFLPWAPSLWGQSEAMRSSEGRSLEATDCAHQVYSAVLETPHSEGVAPALVAWTASGALSALLAYVLMRHGWAGVFLMLVGVLPPVMLLAYSAYSTRSIFCARYFAFAQVAWLAAIAVAAVDIPIREFRWSLGGLMLLWSVFACYENWDLLGPAHNPGMRGAVAHLVGNCREGEGIVAQTPFAYFQMRYYLRQREPPMLCISTPGRLAQRGSPYLMDEDLVSAEQALRSYPRRLWVVTTTSYRADSQVEIPPESGWRFEEEARFAQDCPWERPIVVRCVVRLPASP